MPTPPPCTRMGLHCRELSVTLRVANLDDDPPAFRDTIATWLLGHTERITFGKPYVRGREIRVDAVVNVGCKYLSAPEGTTTGREDGKTGARGRAEVRCAAHGFHDSIAAPNSSRRRTLRHGGDEFTVVQGGQVQRIPLPAKTGRRSLPVLHHGANPCATARCRTADNRMGAACCRDLTIDVIAPAGTSDLLEALLRSRKPPYLCKVKRSDPATIECEVISACGYLADDGVHCSLHGRLRPDGEPAKPEVCSDWPDFEDDEDFTGHPGCVFLADAWTPRRGDA